MQIKVAFGSVTCEFLWDTNFTLSFKPEESLLPSYLEVLTDTASPGRALHSNTKEMLTQKANLLHFQYP